MNENVPQRVPRETAITDLEGQSEHDYEILYESLSPRKKMFVKAMIESFGNISQSCDICNVKTRRTYYNWMQQDPIFKTIIEGCEFEERMIDFAESKLMKNIENKDVASVIFFLKTKGQKRGYIEKQTLGARINPDKKPSWFDDDKSIPEDLEFEMVNEVVKKTDEITDKYMDK